MKFDIQTNESYAMNFHGESCTGWGYDVFIDEECGLLFSFVDTNGEAHTMHHSYIESAKEPVVLEGPARKVHDELLAVTQKAAAAKQKDAAKFTKALTDYEILACLTPDFPKRRSTSQKLRIAELRGDPKGMEKHTKTFMRALDA